MCKSSRREHARIEREEADLARIDGRFLVIGEAGYPVALASLPEAPPALSAIGDLALLGRPFLAIVGGRETSASWPRRSARQDFVIVSGLARGIDAAAHEAALSMGTIAVLAGGIDQIYPLQNAGLHQAIARQGLLLAEAPLGTPPVARAFPRRNRIVSGLGDRHRGGRGGRPVRLPDHSPVRRRGAARSSSSPARPRMPGPIP